MLDVVGGEMGREDGAEGDESMGIKALQIGGACRFDAREAATSSTKALALHLLLLS